jgi:hypothetical protein
MLVPMRRCGHAGSAILLGGWLLMLPPTAENPQDRAVDKRALNLDDTFRRGSTPKQ